MTKLFEVLDRKAHRKLVRDGGIELFTAYFGIKADLEKPDEEDAMKKNLKINDSFTKNLPWLNNEISPIRELCSNCEEDFDNPAKTLLKAALLQERNAIDEAGESVEMRPILVRGIPTVDVWGIVWIVSMGDDGKMSVEYNVFLNVKVMDAVTQEKVRERIRKVNEMMERVMKRFVGGDGK